MHSVLSPPDWDNKQPLSYTGDTGSASTSKNWDISSELSVVEVILSSFLKLIKEGISSVNPGVVERIITDSH